MGNIFSIRLTDEDKIHLQQRMDETGKNATEVFKERNLFYQNRCHRPLLMKLYLILDIMRVKKIWKG